MQVALLQKGDAFVSIIIHHLQIFPQNANYDRNSKGICSITPFLTVQAYLIFGQTSYHLLANSLISTIDESIFQGGGAQKDMFCKRALLCPLAL